jgi:RimJ/RimL family protein N-acetyltransferase
MTASVPRELRTPRLVLRRWREADKPGFAALNADPAVMEFLGPPLRREVSDEWVDRIEAGLTSKGLGLWAVQVTDGPPFVGFVGLNIPAFETPFTPCVEVGWRLARQAWGHGYATEAARAALADGFGRLGLAEIVSFTSALNVRSQRVMQRLGMTRAPADDFDHPRLAADDPLRPHVLYRVRPGHAGEPAG